jgi:DNA-3-methyladenine glycosylase
MLGTVLVHRLADGRRRVGRIVETEGYVGPHDLASHARVGPRGRAQIMYGPAGFAYVFFIYGRYNCFNAVTEEPGTPGAVLVRAVEPLEAAAGERGAGPGLVCQALAIDRACNGLDLTGDRLWLEAGMPAADGEVRMGPRIGVEYAGAWAALPWRFWLPASAHVSRARWAGQPYDPDPAKLTPAGVH